MSNSARANSLVSLLISVFENGVQAVWWKGSGRVPADSADKQVADKTRIRWYRSQHQLSGKVHAYDSFLQGAAHTKQIMSSVQKPRGSVSCEFSKWYFTAIFVKLANPTLFMHSHIRILSFFFEYPNPGTYFLITNIRSCELFIYKFSQHFPLLPQNSKSPPN